MKSAHMESVAGGQFWKRRTNVSRPHRPALNEEPLRLAVHDIMHQEGDGASSQRPHRQQLPERHTPLPPLSVNSLQECLESDVVDERRCRCHSGC